MARKGARKRTFSLRQMGRESLLSLCHGEKSARKRTFSLRQMANSYTQVSHAVQVRAEGPKAHSPGQWTQAARPEGAEALSPGQRPGYNANLQGAL